MTKIIIDDADSATKHVVGKRGISTQDMMEKAFDGITFTHCPNCHKKFDDCKCGNLGYFDVPPTPCKDCGEWPCSCHFYKE